MNTNLDKIIVVGDRVLIKPSDTVDRTRSGLYLPAGYQDKEKVQSGYILKCGPGYPLPSMDDGDSWKPSDNGPRYLPLQVQPGDLALFLQLVERPRDLLGLAERVGTVQQQDIYVIDVQSLQNAVH